MLKRLIHKLRGDRTGRSPNAGLAASVRDLRDELAGLSQKLESVRVHTWIDKEAGIIAAQDVALMTAPRYADPKCLVPHQVQMYSQNGEDGMIAEIFRRIGVGERFFVEVGAGTGIENNSRLLLQTGWRGVWIEADPGHAQQAREHFSDELADGRLTLIESSVTRENVGELLKAASVPSCFDFLSVDIDMNTSYIWQAIHRAGFTPRVACIEYNASVPPSVDWQVAYEADARWEDGSNYFGAGLKVLENLGRAAEMSLVGCEYLGNNAFFVRDELRGDHFLGPYTAERHYEPPRYSLLNHRGHRKYKS
ncbi:MAG: hypothetical protein AAF086_05885 [Planctomycetota bacterium]